MYYENLKILRKEAGKSQEEIAKKIHMHTNQYRRYENGEREVPTNIMILLANYYNVTLDYLTGRTQKYQAFYNMGDPIWKK